jgi:hypothetical protein
MNTLAILGYLIAMCLAPVAPFVIACWYRRIASVVKALRVLSRERRTGETLYDCAEAIAGDAHNWRGMADVTDAPALSLNDDANVVPASGIRARDTMLDFVAPQPPPRNSDGPALWPLIISELGGSETDKLLAADMQARHEFGMAKYGVPLVASNGRDHLADAYQESLDCVVYLRAEIELQLDKRVDETDTHELKGLHQLYIDMLDMAKEVRELIRERDGQ